MNNKFLSQTYLYVMFSMLLATVGSLLGLNFIGSISLPILILIIVLELGSLIALMFFYKKRGLNILLYSAFSFLTGLSMTPLLAKAISIDPSLILTAFLLTAIAVGGLSLYAISTKRDFSGMGKYLFILLLIVIVGSLLNLFLQLPILHLALTVVSVILFSFYLIYDTQAIINGEYDSPLMAAISIYIDVLNLFINILDLLIQINDDD